MNRKIDELGRIVIPKEIRKQLGIKTGDELEIKVVNGQIILSNFEEKLKLDQLLELISHYDNKLNPEFKQKAINIMTNKN